MKHHREFMNLFRLANATVPATPLALREEKERCSAFLQIP